MRRLVTVLDFVVVFLVVFLVVCAPEGEVDISTETARREAMGGAG
jgi:hypothetical protein